MTYQELQDLLVENLTRVGSNRITGPEVLEATQAVSDYFHEREVTYGAGLNVVGSAVSVSLGNGSGTTGSGAGVNLGGVLSVDANIGGGGAAAYGVSFGGSTWTDPIKHFKSYSKGNSKGIDLYHEAVSGEGVEFFGEVNGAGVANANMVAWGTGAFTSSKIRTRTSGNSAYVDLISSTTVASVASEITVSLTSIADTDAYVSVGSNSSVFRGILYASDYSVNFTARSVIDMGYANSRLLGQPLAAPTAGEIGKSIRWSAGGAWEYYVPGSGGSSYIFSNGLNEASGAVKLGGPLTQHTVFTGNFDFSIGSLASPVQDFSVYSATVYVETPDLYVWADTLRLEGMDLFLSPQTNVYIAPQGNVDIAANNLIVDAPAGVAFGASGSRVGAWVNYADWFFVDSGSSGVEFFSNQGGNFKSTTNYPGIQEFIFNNSALAGIGQSLIQFYSPQANANSPLAMFQYNSGTLYGNEVRTVAEFNRMATTPAVGLGAKVKIYPGAGPEAGIASVMTNVTGGSQASKYIITGAYNNVETTFMEISRGSVLVPNLSNATTANVLYYDSTTGQVTYGAAPGSGWNLNGNTVTSEKWFGTIDNFNIPIKINNIEIAAFKANGLHTGVNPTFGLGETLSIAEGQVINGANPFIQFAVSGSASGRIRMSGVVAMDFTLPTGGTNFNFTSGSGTELVVSSNYGHMRNSFHIGGAVTWPTARLEVRGSGTTTGELIRFTDSADAIKFKILDSGWVNIGQLGSAGVGEKLSVNGPVVIGSTTSTFTDMLFAPSTGSGGGIRAYDNRWELQSNRYLFYNISGSQSFMDVGVYGKNEVNVTNQLGVGGINPTARVHVKGLGSTTGEMFVLQDSLNNVRLKVLDNGTITISAPAADAGFATSQLLSRDSSGNVDVIAASGGGTTTFLRADGTWATPPGGGGGLADAYTSMTDGTTTSTSSGATAFKFRSASNLLTVAVTNNDATHGDNLLLTVNSANFTLTQSQITNLTTDLAAKQAQLNGTGFVKVSGTTVSYDNSTYLTANQSITLSGAVSGSGTTAITTTLGSSVVGFSNIVNSAAAGLSVIGRSANSAGVFAEIVAGSDGHVLRRSGTALGFGTVDAAGITNNAVTYAKMQQASAGYTIMAKVGTGAGNYAELAAGADSVLRRSGSGDLAFGTLVTNHIADAQVTYAKIQNVATSRILGRVTAGVGVVEEVTGTQITALLDTFTTSLKGLVPASGGGTSNFLRADGSWVAPPGGGGGSSAGSITIEFYNGGDDLTTGVKDTPVIVPTGFTVSEWQIMAYDASNALLSTSAVVDILSDSFANLPLSGSDSMAGSEKPTLSAASTANDSTLSTWTAITSGNYIQGEIESIGSGVKKLVVVLKGTKS